MPLVLVTGASAGIGAACARKFAAEGWRVLAAARSLDRLRALAGDVNAAHGEERVRPVALDVADAGAWAAVLGAQPEGWRGIDVLVNNAGLAKGLKPVWENTAGEVDRVVDTNVKGVLNGYRAVVPGMLARGRGHVIDIGSTAGHAVYPGGTVYCATKHAVLTLNDGLKKDLHGTPVRVSAVSPGLVETEFSLVRFDGDAGRADRVYRDTEPLTAEDVAEAVWFCASAPAHVNVVEVLVTPRVQSGLLIATRDGGTRATSSSAARQD